jgi:hypothetical protein
MKIGDKVKVKPEYGRAFSDCTGTIVATMLPDYDWAVQIDRISMDSEDSYGFDEPELEVI